MAQEVDAKQVMEKMKRVARAYKRGFVSPSIVTGVVALVVTIAVGAIVLGMVSAQVTNLGLDNTTANFVTSVIGQGQNVLKILLFTLVIGALFLVVYMVQNRS